MIAVLDGGAVSALAPVDERARARLRALRSEAEDIVVPAGVLAEGLLTGHPHRDFHVRRLLELTRIAKSTPEWATPPDGSAPRSWL